MCKMRNYYQESLKFLIKLKCLIPEDNNIYIFKYLFVKAYISY